MTDCYLLMVAHGQLKGTNEGTIVGWLQLQYAPRHSPNWAPKKWVEWNWWGVSAGKGKLKTLFVCPFILELKQTETVYDSV